MKPRLFPVLLLMCIVLSSCASSFLVSTLNTTSNPYIPQPIKQKDEPNITETYAGVHLGAGMNVEYWGDYFAAANFRIAQSHALGRFRLGYGGNLSLGGFYAGPALYGDSDMSAYRVENGGKLFLGAFGSNVLASYAVPLPKNKGEWRFGLEGSYHKEFGDYLHFRKRVPGHIDIGVEKRPFTYTAGFFSEWVRLKKKGQFGVKIGGSLGFYQAFKNIGNPLPDYIVDYKYEDEIPALPFYISTTFFQRFKKLCVFEQISFGTAIFAFQYGVLFRLHGSQH